MRTVNLYVNPVWKELKDLEASVQNLVVGAVGGSWSTATQTGVPINIVTNSDGNSLYYGNYLTTAALSNHAHDYQPVGNYLTTAMQSASSSVFAKTGFTTASVTGTEIKGTNNTDGLSLLIPNYLTTAATGGGGGVGTGTTIATTSGIILKVTANSDGLNISYPNAITTAAISNHTHSDLSSVYQSTGAYLTTAMQSASSSVFAKIGFTSSSTGGSDIKATHNTDGLSMLIPNYLTVAAGAGDGVNIIAAGGSTAASTGTYVFSNSNGISFSLNGSTITAQHNALTTAAASDHTHSNLYLNTSVSSAYQTATLASTFAQTANVMLTGERANYFYSSNNTFLPQANSTQWATGTLATALLPLANSTQWATGTLSSALMPLSYSSGFQTATLANTFMDKSYSSAFQTATLANTFMDKSYSSAFQTATLANTFMDKSYSSAFQTATLANTFMDKSYSSGFQTGTLSSALMPLSYSSGFQTGTLATVLLPLANSTQWATGTLSSALMPLAYSSKFATGTLSTDLMALSYSSAFQTATLATKFLTTAAVTDHTHSNLYLPLGNSTQWATGTLSSALMPLSYSSGFQTATLATKFLTTAAAADHTHGATSTASTAGVDLKVTSASNGFTIGVPAWITTAAAGGGVAIAGSNTTYTSGTVVFRGTNVTVSTSAGGQYIDLSVAAPGAGGGIAASISAGGNSTSAGSGYSNITSGTMFLQGGDNITLSQNGAKISIIGATANGPASVYFSDGNGISWGSSTSGSSTTISVSSHGGDGTIGFYEPYVQTNTSAWVPGVGSWYFAPFIANNAIGGGRLNFLANNTSTAGIMVDVTGSYHSSQTGGKNQSYTYQLSAALWTQGTGDNSTRWESIWGNTFSYGISHRLSVSQSGAASNVSASMYASISYIQDIGFNGETTMSQFATSNAASGTNTSMASTWLRTDGASIRNMLSNQQMLVVPFNTTISEGNYILGIMYSSTHATGTSGTSYPGASALIMSNLNVVGIARAALAGYRKFGQTTSNASDSPFFGAGVVYSAASAAAPQYLRTQDMATIANGIIPYFNFQRRGLTN